MTYFPQKGCVLFVDDEPLVLDGLKRLLKPFTDRWTPAFASTVEDAVERLTNGTFDIAVLDIMMPQGGGLELLRLIKNHPEWEDIEVVMLTGLKDADLKRQALELGAVDLLTKPIGREDLIARLDNALRLRRLHEELKAHNAFLEHQLLHAQKMELISVLAAGAAYDLRHILTAVLGYSELTERLVPKHPAISKNIEQIHGASARAKKLIQRIIEFARPGTSTHATCNLAAIITECLELLHPSLIDAIEIEWTPTQLTHTLQGDCTKLYQVVMNVCLNAIEAMKHGGTLRVQLNERSFDANALPPNTSVQPGWYAVLEVEDTGVGMNEAVRARIFEPLFSTKGTRGGMGLGLAVVQRVLNEHSGWIHVESRLGQGTTFQIGLPLDAHPNESAPDKTETTHVRE